MKKLSIGICLMLVQFLCFDNSLIAATAKVTLRVVDENGKPVNEFPVNAGFYAGEKFHGRTDTNGLFVMEGNAPHWEVNWILQKEGYYRSQIQYEFKGGIKDEKWQPWNTIVAAVVRPIVNPIPMYVKKVGNIIPVTNAPCGYDLMIGDWVNPNGKGEHSDLIFKISTRRVASWTNCEGNLTMTFANNNDGVRIRDDIVVGGSSFPWPYLAPKDNYSKAFQVSMGYVPGKGYFENNPSSACYFRVRTVTNEAGKVVSANYGKIPGPLKFDVREGETGWLGFTYYLNPTPNDRNIEFDSKRNLFNNLKANEQVNSP